MTTARKLLALALSLTVFVSGEGARPVPTRAAAVPAVRS